MKTHVRCVVRVIALVLAPAVSAQSIYLRVNGSTNSRFGTVVDNLDDLDGDGTAEILVGSPFAASNSGEVFVFDGRTGATRYSVASFSASTWGARIATIGDVSGDGLRDFVVGSPHDNLGMLSHNGAVYVYSGANGQLLYKRFGASTNDLLGSDVAAFEDFNGDQVPDFLVGVEGAGVCHCIGAVLILSGLDGSTLASFNGGGFAESAGSAVAALDDIDGDGKRDVVSFGNGNSALVRAWSSATGTVLFTALASPSYLPSHQSNWFAVRSDLDGDGKRDLLVGVNSSVRVCSGATGQLIRVINDPCGSGTNGWIPETVGDRDGDGIDEIAAVDIARGKLHVVSGATGAPLSNVLNPYLWSVLPTADRNGDGIGDWLVGLPSYGGGAPHHPQVQLWTDAVKPAVGTPFAFGDGSASPCPCGNFGQAGAGCANSTGVGARLDAWGTASVVESNLQLRSTGIPAHTSSVLIRGSQSLNHGLPHWDGLRAAGGAIVRMKSGATCAANEDWGPFNFMSLAQPGVTLAFQVWYRDANGPCGTGANFSNGVRISFTP